MLKRVFLALAAAAGMWVGSASAQVNPGGGGAGPGQGGFQIDPAMLQQIQQMQDMGQQIMQNMQNAGIDPQQFMQEQMQNGNFDPAAMQQVLVDKGVMTQDQANQMNNMMNQMQQGFQNQGGALRTNMALNNIRQQLNVVSDDEWNVLLPKIQRVLSALGDVLQNNNGQMSTGMVPAAGGFGAANRLGGGAAAGGPGAANPQANETPIDKAWRELREAVQDDQRPEAEVLSKLTTWRTLHERARNELDSAQKDLVQILTLRQEAVLLWQGLL